MGRIGLGTALTGVSALPIFNIPYVGTGLGGALYELGQGIVEGDKLPELAKRAGTGFVVGETVGAIPYVGKFAGKTKAGQAVGNQASKLYNYLADTKVGQKVAEIAPKVEDALMTDVTGKWIKGYHGTPHKFDNFDFNKVGTTTDSGMFGNGFYFTAYPDIAKSYAKQDGYIKKVNLDLKNPLVINTKSQIDEIDSIVDATVPNKTIEDFMNGPQNYSKAFKKYVFDNGYDSVVDNVTRKGEQYVAFLPEQIKSGNLADYLLKDSVLTKGYRQNKDIIDTQASKLYEYLKDYNSMKPGYMNLGGKDDYLDLTGIFDNNVSKEEIANYIQSLANEGPMATKTPDYLIDIPNFRRYKKHIQYPTGYDEMPRTDKKRHNSLAMKLKEMINNSTHTGLPKANSKPDLKPNVDKYHYFTVNVKVGDEVIPVVLDAEQLIGESTIKPQTVHLYNFGEK